MHIGILIALSIMVEYVTGFILSISTKMDNFTIVKACTITESFNFKRFKIIKFKVIKNANIYFYSYQPLDWASIILKY